MKKIAILCNYDPRPNRIGGMDLFFVKFNKKLLNNNYEVLWMFHEFQYFDLYKDFNVHIPKKEESLANSFLNYSNQNNFIPDTLITHFIETINPFYKKCKKNGIKKIYTVDHMPRPLEGYSLSKRLKKRIKGILYAKYTDKIIGVSNYIIKMTKNDYGFRASKRVEVIHNGIDVEKFIPRKEALPSAKIKFIVPTNLRPEKGIQDLIQAVSLLDSKTKESFIIDIYGTGTHEELLKKMVVDLNLENNIVFKGSTTKLPELYHLYNFTIQPTYMEVFSLTILESLACNVPVITTPVGGNLEAVTHLKNGIIFNPKDIKQLSSIIYKIVNNQLNVSDTDTRTLIEKSFTIDKMVEKHFKII